MELTEIVTKTTVKHLGNFGMYVGRLFVEAMAIYGVGALSGLEPKQALFAAAAYGISRNGADAVDALIFKQGRLYDRLTKAQLPENISAEEK